MIHLFRRRAERAGGIATPTLPRGTLPCSEHGCVSQEGLRCAYADRRRRPCDTAWCPEHVVEIGGQAYCRRHAGVVRALPTGQDYGLPDVTSRAPSLLEHVTATLGAPIEALLRPYATGGLGLQQDGAHVVFLPEGRDRVRAWERTWKVFDHTGIHLWVALLVRESEDLDVLVRVNGNIVASEVPPWIAMRHSGVELTKDQDAESRRKFYERLVTTVRRHLEVVPPR